MRGRRGREGGREGGRGGGERERERENYVYNVIIDSWGFSLRIQKP